jgi:hypothetical protein
MKRSPFYQLDDEVIDWIESYGLSRAEIRVFFHLLKKDRFGDGFTVDPDEIAESLQIGRTTVYRAIQIFSSKGWFEITKLKASCRNATRPKVVSFGPTVRTQTLATERGQKPSSRNSNPRDWEKSNPGSAQAEAYSVPPDLDQTFQDSPLERPLNSNFQREILNQEKQPEQPKQIEEHLRSGITPQDLTQLFGETEVTDRPPWITSGGQFDPKFFEYVQNKAEKLPDPPKFPMAVARKMISTYGEFLWQDYQRWRRNQEQLQATRRIAVEEQKEDEHLNTREGRLKWLRNLWKGPCHFVAENWFRSEGQQWGFTFDSDGYPSDPNAPA